MDSLFRSVPSVEGIIEMEKKALYQRIDIMHSKFHKAGLPEPSADNLDAEVLLSPKLKQFRSLICAILAYSKVCPDEAAGMLTNAYMEFADMISVAVAGHTGKKEYDAYMSLSALLLRMAREPYDSAKHLSVVWSDAEYELASSSTGSAASQ